MPSKIVIGIDPDSKAHGVAIYINKDLKVLNCMTLMELHGFLTVDVDFAIEDVTVHIENVDGNKSVWHGRQQSKAAFGQTSQRVAKCKQAQLELERMLDWLGVEVVRHKISKAWKTGETQTNQFKKITKWKGRSNEDTRSAAYFGYLGSN